MGDLATGGIGDTLERRGIMLVLSSPSGAGKSTIARNLLDKDEQSGAFGLRDHAAAPHQ